MTPVWSAADVARATRLPKGGLLLMLQCYFDDSGTHSGSKCTVWGGVVGTVEQFSLLESKWLAILRNPPHNKPPINKFGMADCRGRLGEFVRYNDAESDHLIYCLRNVILDSGVIPLGWGTSVKAWDKHVTGSLRAFLGTATSASYAYCSKVALQIAEANDDLISIVFDQGQKSIVLEMLYSGACRVVPEGAKRAAQSFLPVERFPGLQAADMVATSFYWHGVNLIKNRNASPDAHLKRLIEGAPETTFGMFFERDKSNVA